MEIIFKEMDVTIVSLSKIGAAKPQLIMFQNAKEFQYVAMVI